MRSEHFSCISCAHILYHGHVPRLRDHLSTALVHHGVVLGVRVCHICKIVYMYALAVAISWHTYRSCRRSPASASVRPCPHSQSSAKLRAVAASDRWRPTRRARESRPRGVSGPIGPYLRETLRQTLDEKLPRVLRRTAPARTLQRNDNTDSACLRGKRAYWWMRLGRILRPQDRARWTWT